MGMRQSISFIVMSVFLAGPILATTVRVPEDALSIPILTSDKGDYCYHRILCSFETTTRPEMRLVMNKYVQALVTISMVLYFGADAVPAVTVVLDFEDLTGQDEPIPNGYGGIASWGDESAYWTTWDNPDDDFPPHSGVRRCISTDLGAPIRFGAEYVFEGSWLAGRECAGSWSVWYELYLAGELVHTSESIQPYRPARWFPSGYDLTVDEVRIMSNYDWCPFCMDDFTYVDPTVGSEEMTWGSVRKLFR